MVRGADAFPAEEATTEASMLQTGCMRQVATHLSQIAIASSYRLLLQSIHTTKPRHPAMAVVCCCVCLRQPGPNTVLVLWLGVHQDPLVDADASLSCFHCRRSMLLFRVALWAALTMHACFFVWHISPLTCSYRPLSAPCGGLGYCRQIRF